MTEHTRLTRAFKDVRTRKVGAAPSSLPPHRERPWLLLALAASLIVCFTLGALTLIQHHELQLAGSPSLNPLILDLDPEGVAVRGGDQKPTKVPLSASPVVLILNLFEPKVYPRYALDITDQRGRVLWSSMDIRRTEVGNFTVVLQPGFLPRAPCSIHLFGLESEHRRMTLATYQLELDSEKIP